MVIPTSKILRASKVITGIQANVRCNSPSQGQSQRVFVTVNNNPAEANRQPQQDTKVVYPKNEKGSVNPYSDEKRDIKSAMQTTQDTFNAEKSNISLYNDQSNLDKDETIEEQTNVIKALSLIIEIIQNNPLIVNKYIVATEEDLKQLIGLLVGMKDGVSIDLEDIECGCSTPKFRVIKRIWMIDAEGNQYSISQYPVIMKLFDTYRISLNLVTW